ncbi:MAG TPA: LysR family transcriptional regulator [Steroidobacteraceae bacterium]|nr:LysR family transcriptional regulator [Steroidobacteraceae bacterium]
MRRELGPVLPDLHLLTVLAQTQSFTQAARRLGLSKASVSVRISELEKTAGVPLVRRTTRSVVLTEAGLRLAQDIEASFARIAESFDNVKDLAGAPRGLVRVTAAVALGRQIIAPALPGFLREYPEIRLELDLSDRLINLAQEGFDLAIRHTDNPPDTYVAWRLCESRSLLVASQAYLKRRGTPDHPAELADHDCLMYLRDPDRSWSFERARGRKRSERISVLVNGPLRANNSEVLREAVLGGVGIGLLPDFTAADALARGSLQHVLSDWKPVGFFGQQIYAIRPWTAQVPRAVRCLVDHLRQVFEAK